MGGFGSGPAKRGQPRRESQKLRAPSGLVPEARSHFKRLAALAATHGLTRADEPMLAQLATALWMADAAAAQLAREGLTQADATHGGELRKHPAVTIWRAAMSAADALARQFGFSPSSRLRLGLEEASGELDPYEEFKLELERAIDNKRLAQEAARR